MGVRPWRLRTGNLAQRHRARPYESLRHVGERRQREQAIRQTAHDGKIAIACGLLPGAPAVEKAAEPAEIERAEDRRFVQHPPAIADARVALDFDGHALRPRRVHERPAVPSPRVLGCVLQDEFEEATASRVRRGRDRLERRAVRQLRAQDVVVVPAPPIELLEPGETAERQEDRVEVRAILEAEADVIGVERASCLTLLEPAVVPEHEHPIEQHGVVRHRDAGFAARNSLRALQTETADVAPRADRPAAIAGAVGVRAVFDQRQAVLPRDVGEAVERRGVAPQMHDADRARSRCYATGDIVGVGQQRAGVDVAEDRPAAALEDRRRGGEEGIAGHDDLGPRLDACREVRAVQRRRAAVHRQGVLRAGQLREPPLELRDRAVAPGRRAHVAARAGEDPQDVGQPNLAPSLAIRRAHGTHAPVDGQIAGAHRPIPCCGRVFTCRGARITSPRAPAVVVGRRQAGVEGTLSCPAEPRSAAG